MTTTHSQNHHHRSNVSFTELSALLLNIIRSPPPPLHFSDHPPPTRHQRRHQITPSEFASLLLGLSLSLMLCGSLTFFIGFVLMPWVLALLFFFYFLGLLSTLSIIARSILCFNSPPPRKDAASAPTWKVL